MVKKMAGRHTRNFRNFHHDQIVEQDFGGPRVILDNRYKLVIHDGPNREPSRELFDLRSDPAEKANLNETMPEVAAALERQLHQWQESVLHSLTGADYR